MVSTIGGYVADDAGMGKTLLIALAMAIYAQWCEPEKSGVTGKKHIGYRPSLYLAPSAGVAEQAYQTIRKHFPDRALIPLLCSGDYPDAAEDAAYYVDKEELRAGKKTKHKHFKAALNTKHMTTAKYIMISTYRSNLFRSWKKPKSEKGKGEKKKVKKAKRSKTDNFTEGKDLHQLKWYGRVIYDECQEIRNYHTQTNETGRERKAPVNLMVSATATLNDESDILGSLSLLWPNIEQRLKTKHSDIWKSWYKNGKALQGETPWSLLEDLADIEEGGPIDLQDPRRLAAFNPWVIQKLLECMRNLAYGLGKAGLYYKYLTETGQLLRNPSTHMPVNATQKLSLAKLVPQPHIRTELLRPALEEHRDVEIMQMLAAKMYCKALTDPNNKGPAKVQNGRPQEDKKDGPMLSVVAQARFGSIVASSYQAANLHLMLDGETTVDKFDRRRHKLHNAQLMFGDVTDWQQDMPTTQREMMKWLSYGSPKLRYLIEYYATKVMRSPDRKLMVCEDIPFSAWFWELAFATMNIPAATYHGDLSEKQRRKMVADFNDPNSTLRVLICEYGCTVAGMNFQKCCNDVFVCTAGVNLHIEHQVQYRPCRADQVKPQVNIVRACVMGTEDELREDSAARKMLAMANLSMGSADYPMLAKWASL
ncbi:hypothetical protein TI39_contig4182g00005 [Zymoseptoria brevis]|uniref:Helicase ATP-binding domain-containing protein n=1 Tax=Zymoseptoria brevis TaxID=1047168 RepID=A0A0F4GEB5_9PEZI|nr:hypothetical protein TI39_contig4182g00005 [Zymoseptoria brevis]